MNNTMLYTALLSVLCTTTVYADTRVQAPTTTPSPATMPAGIKQAPTSPSAPVAVKPAPVTGTVSPSNIPAPQPAPVINCKYRIPAETTNIEQSLISTWAGKAAVQSFDFNPATIDDELVELKPCYTDQGWQGFNDALQKSGNVAAIKSQHLTVSSQVDGDVKINPIKDNQWKVTVPMQVVYQNDKEKLTQLLTVDLLIGRKISGDLGIMQMIAAPRQAALTEQPTGTTPTASNPTTPTTTTSAAPAATPAPVAAEATAPAAATGVQQPTPMPTPASGQQKPAAGSNQPVQTIQH